MSLLYSFVRQTGAHCCGVNPELLEEICCGVGTLARENRERPGGEGRAARACGVFDGAELTGVDADGRQRRSIEGVFGGAGRRQVDAERAGGFGGRVVKDAEEEVVGAKAAVAPSARLVGGRGQHQPPRILAEPLDHHMPRLAYFACTDWRETPGASPICSHDQPCSRASRT